MASTKADEVKTHAVSPVSIFGGGAGAAAGGVPPGAGALVAGGASVVVCAITTFAMTATIVHAAMPNTISSFTITRCRKIVFIAISFARLRKKGRQSSQTGALASNPDRKSTRLNSSHDQISYAV